MAKAKGSPGNQYTGPVQRDDRSTTLADLHITKNQSSEWQRLADVPKAQFEAALARETTRLPPTGRAIVDEAFRLDLQAELNAKAAGLTPEQIRQRFGNGPGLEARLWRNIAPGIDPVTGARRSDPKPDPAMLAAAEAALADFLAKFNFNDPAMKRIRRLITEAHGIVVYLQAGDVRH
jgi:hypothetical protein